jgi:methionyl-tRNA formyltransferase
MAPIRAGFVTCVELGLSCIREIYEVGGSLDCVLTLHDHLSPRKSGRVYLDDFCREHAVPLFKLRNVNDADALEYLRARDLDWLFIIGWSQIAGPAVLQSSRLGVLGAHPTLLPVGRGRAAIPWAILKRLPETGVTLFQLDSGVDTGPIVAQERVPMSPRETATELYAKIATAHRALVRRAWPGIAQGDVPRQPQDEMRASVWPGRTPEDGRLRPEMSVADAEVLVRAATRPYPGAFLDMPDGRLRVWAGRPAVGGDPGHGRGRLLRFSDGEYVATEYEPEPLPSATPAASSKRALPG